MHHGAFDKPAPVPKGRALLFLAACVLATASCGGKGGDGRPGMEDATGARVETGGRPARIVSLMPSVTESLFRVGAGGRLVGVTTYCTRPPEAASIEKIGTFLGPDVEKIVSLRPDLVIAGKVGRPEPVLKLRSVGIKVFVLPSESSLADVLRNFRTVAELAGESESAESLLASVESRFAALRKALEGRRPVRVFVQMGARPMITVGSGNFVRDVLEAAGASNAADGLGDGWPRAETETVLSLDPEAILVTTMTGFPEEEKDRWAGYSGLSAAKSGRIHLVNGDDLCRPDPFALASAAEELARLLHPEAFGK